MLYKKGDTVKFLGQPMDKPNGRLEELTGKIIHTSKDRTYKRLIEVYLYDVELEDYTVYKMTADDIITKII